MSRYTKFSPYFTTPENNLYLGLLKIRPVPAEADDFEYIIQSQYRHRPDLLAYDVYGNAKLWWAIVQRNLDKIKDPIYDFEPGVIIKLPKKTNLEKYLGV